MPDSAFMAFTQSVPLAAFTSRKGDTGIGAVSIPQQHSGAIHGQNDFASGEPPERRRAAREGKEAQSTSGDREGGGVLRPQLQCREPQAAQDHGISDD